MMIDRRSVVAGATLVAIAPSLESLLSLSSAHKEANRIVFMIDGWSVDDGSRASDRVWIRLDRSWRAAWR
jgi:hypothetical protein